MNYNYIILGLAILIVILLIILLYKHKDEQEYYRELTASKLISGSIQSGKDLINYTSEKWLQLKNFLREHYKEALIRKMFKFLNNSDLEYLGPDQNIDKNPYLRKRKLRTSYNTPNLLQMYCKFANTTKDNGKQWLINIMKANFDDYLYEQWSLKSTLKRAILNLGQNFGILSGEDILNKYILEVINENYGEILSKLTAFENKNGINVCSGKKKSIISKLFS